MKRLICMILALLSLVTCISVSAAMPTMEFDIMSQSVLLVNTDTDTVIYEQNADQKQPTIAFNKIVTAIIAMENTEDIDAAQVTVSYNAANNEALGGYGSGVMEGEIYSMRDMLASILISSANDCCIAIAEEIAGSEDNFVAKMNELAQRLGCDDTNFTDVHGIDDEGQFTTCRDMKAIIEYARTLPGFYEMCCQSSYMIDATNMQGERKITTNISMMVKSSSYYYSAIRGIKYGYTPASGRNFVSTATKNGYNYMLITMNGPVRDSDGNKLEENSAFNDAENLYKWAFDNFRIKEILSENVPIADVDVKFSLDSNTVQAIPETTITAVVPKNIKTNELSESGDLEYVFDLPESLTAPVNKGQVLGTLTVKLDGKTLGEVSLLAGQSLGKSEYIYVIEKIKEIAAHTWFKVIIGVLAGLVVIYITIAIVSNFRRTAKRKLKREQEEMRRRNDEQDGR